MDRNTITSVGIDIGTSTLQVAFARLVMENTARYFSVPRVAFTDKELIYKSPVHFTPLLTRTMIDEEAVRRIVRREYERARVTPENVDTGAVIITGESARKENAAALLDSLSDLAGDFVVSTVGPDLEAVIAGKGSGAARYSQSRGIRVANMDIGGGTTNIAVFDDGETVAKGSYDIGGRLVRVEDGRFVHVSESAVKIALSKGLRLELGGRADSDLLRKVCRTMAGLLEQALGIAPPSPLLSAIRTHGSTPFCAPSDIRALCFSGGVADCVSSAEGDPFRYGDIGPMLGEAIRQSRLCADFFQYQPEETICATVVGAGAHTTSVSGSTILHREDILPMKNIPVLKLDSLEQERCYEGDAPYLREKLRWFLNQSDASELILALAGDSSPSYNRLRTLAGCVYEAMNAVLPEGVPILLALESDTALALGRMIEALAGAGRSVICVDALHTEQGDYVDLGRPMMDGMIIPVVIKTLAFG
ncbi:ethanolamine utilization protein EutA [Synergistales bacterium]|nr:ethanolamine utilization protein EutA [Synergistales bacterium]